MLHLDGSHGEGGGQILRTALSLAANQEQPVRIDNIRDKKSMPWGTKGGGG
jgi:RNA 3'-terminal phosphate cyclase (ATP)